MSLRFPNPGADLTRMLSSYRLIHSAASKETNAFDLDFMTHVLAKNFQASSRGAIGTQAIVRSTQEDRSRDPLYNQLKMYSEIFRNLGLLRPTDRRLEFKTTILGDLLVEDFYSSSTLVNGLISQCILSMTFPNSSSENFGVVAHRPFRWLLLLAHELDGAITRHEMILGLLAVTNDRAPGLLNKSKTQILKLRSESHRHLLAEVEEFAGREGVQANTLENYTRFPIGVMKSSITGWGDSTRVAGIYEKPVQAISLKINGCEISERLSVMRDIRFSDLGALSFDERVGFSRYAYYAMVYRSGLHTSELLNELKIAGKASRHVLRNLGISGPDDFIYSPVLEETEEVLDAAASIGR